MARTREEIQSETKRLKKEYGDLFDGIAEILLRHDPIDINFGHNTDEYYPEVRSILPLLKTCHSPQEVMATVHGEFQRWFDEELAGPKEEYRKIAEEMWKLWQESPSNCQHKQDGRSRLPT